VLAWPNRRAIVGYVGQGGIGDQPTDEWLYDFMGRNFAFGDFASLASDLTDDLNALMASGEIDSGLLVHLGGFEEVAAEWTPRIWFIRNTTDLTHYGPNLGTEFVASEEIAQPTYFGTKTGNDIRGVITSMVSAGGLFSFRQGYDLIAFNMIDEALRAAMQRIVKLHPLQLHSFPTTLAEWAKHLRMAVLGYSAYFGAFYAPFEQYVGGGADVVSVPWPPLGTSEITVADSSLPPV
jgi:hypothetical protein